LEAERNRMLNNKSPRSQNHNNSYALVQPTLCDSRVIDKDIKANLDLTDAGENALDPTIRVQAPL
jgi:hypothetical protein